MIDNPHPLSPLDINEDPKIPLGERERALGWTNQRQREFAIYATEGLMPGRVVSEHRSHYRAVTDCVKKVAINDDKHAAIIGIAMDGFPIAARVNIDGKEPDDLDSCRAHKTAGLGYHYHVADPGKNEILPCLRGETGCTFEGGSQTCSATMWGSIRRTIGRWVGWK